MERPSRLEVTYDGTKKATVQDCTLLYLFFFFLQINLSLESYL